jgi:SAM-dependent methyltransferase
VSGPGRDVDPRWYDGFFEAEGYHRLARADEAERTRDEVDFVLERLELEPGARVLDLACGRGRHSIELARRGFRVTGVDLSPRSLELAHEAVHAAGVEVELVHADMRAIDYDAEFDGALNLFTAFGYFEDEADDRLVLERVARALRPGGGFLLDTLNPLWLARGFRPREWRELDDGTLMLEERAYDPLSGRVAAVWTFVGPDGKRSELRHSIRSYTPAELAGMFRAAGLAVEGAWAEFDGSPLALDSEGHRVILLGRRPPEGGAEG